MSEDGIFCRIVEYEISWPSNIDEFKLIKGKLVDPITNKKAVYKADD